MPQQVAARAVAVDDVARLVVQELALRVEEARRQVGGRAMRLDLLQLRSMLRRDP